MYSQNSVRDGRRRSRKSSLDDERLFMVVVASALVASVLVTFSDFLH